MSQTQHGTYLTWVLHCDWWLASADLPSLQSHLNAKCTHNTDLLVRAPEQTYSFMPKQSREQHMYIFSKEVTFLVDNLANSATGLSLSVSVTSYFRALNSARHNYFFHPFVLLLTAHCSACSSFFPKNWKSSIRCINMSWQGDCKRSVPLRS